MHIVFFGTPHYVVPIVDALHKKFRTASNETPVEAVVTQPPKPVGRKKVLEFSAVDDWAHKKGIQKFFDPKDILTNNVKADLGILASYGQLIPKEVINYFPLGILVVHPSLLPNFRWASPVQAALVTGTDPTGVSIIKMDDKWDHGRIVAQFKEDVSPEDTYGVLRDRLFLKTADVLVDMIPAYLKSKIRLKPQDDSKASFARMIAKEDAYVEAKFLEAAIKGEEPGSDWKIDFLKMPDGKAYVMKPNAENVYRFIRAMEPWPGVWTRIKVKGVLTRLKLLKSHLENGKLVPDEVQLEGKNRVSWKQFTEAYPFNY